MSGKERSRMVEMAGVASGQQSLAAAARRLGLSYRQAKRVWRRYRAEGAAGLAHQSRGRDSNRRTSEEIRGRCLETYRERLAGFGPTLAAEKLAEWGLDVDHETLRRWLMAEDLWVRQRKRGPHRHWRERKHRFGELVQIDGSFHDWFSDGTTSCLMNMVDDATSKTLSLLSKEETTEAAMLVLWAWIEKYGIPLALYSDKKNVYVIDREPTVEEQLEDRPPLSAFGKACAKLGIEIIAASSPQAKGRVERNHGVYQDRLVKEFRLLGIGSIAAANKVLTEGFSDNLNRKFGKQPLSAEDAHRCVAPDVDLAAVFAYEETRTVNNDWTVRYHNRWFQITGPRGNMPPAKKKVIVQERLDGTINLLYRDLAMNHTEISGPPPRAVRESPIQTRRTPARPAPDHPWRQSRRTARHPGATAKERTSPDATPGAPS